MTGTLRAMMRALIRSVRRLSRGFGTRASGLPVVAVALVALGGCTTPGSVTVLSAAPAATPLGQSYAWGPRVPGGAPAADNDIVRSRIEASANRVLAAKGYRLAAPDTAQLLFAYHIGLQQKTGTRVDQSTSMGVPVGMTCGRHRCTGGWGWGYYGPPQTSVTTYDYTEGSLIVDAVDRASGKLAWRAVYRQRIDAKSAEQERIDRAVDAALKTLPAAAG